MNPFLFRRIRGPIFLLCFALTAILNQWHILSFGDSWPLYLITAGALRILEVLLVSTASFAAFPPVALPRQRSLTSGVLLLAIGVVALLITTGALPSFAFWHTYALWWPLLLVLLGVLLLAERLLDRGFYARRYPNGAYSGYQRRRGGGLVGLVVLLVLLGVVSHHGYWGHWNGQNWNGNDWNWPSWDFNFGGQTYENDVTLAQAVVPDGSLLIENARGDVQVAPSADGILHVEAHQMARVPEHDKAHAFAATRPQIAVNGSQATLTVPEQQGVDVRLEVQMPAGVLCTVHTHHGDVAVSGLKRPLEIEDDHGDVTLDDLGNTAHLQMDHGDVQARSVAGDVAVDGRADDIDLSGIGGRIALQGEFFGNTQIDSAQGPVQIHSSRTNLDLAHLTGSLSLDADDLRVDGAAGGMRLTTRSKDIEVDGLTGDASITDSNGDIHVSARQPLGALTLNDSTGDITLSLPAGSNFSLNGVTGSEDTIESDWGLVQSTENDSKSIRGQVGTGGPSIELRTDHGDLTLRRVAADVDQPEKPEKPEKPEAQPLRHLHAAGPVPAPTAQ